VNVPNANFTKAKIFDNNDYGSTADPSELPTGDFTVEFLYYSDPDTPADTEAILAIYASTGTEKALTIGRGNSSASGQGKYINFLVTADGSTWKGMASAAALTDSQWHYIACTFDAGAEMRIYVNGNLSTATTSGIPASMKNSTSGLFYGRYNASWGGNNALEGLLCGVRISNTVRTAKEIYEVWNGAAITSVAGSTSLSTNLVSHWPFEETSGTRNDSKSTNHLTDNATVLYGTGVQGNCADFESTNTEYLSIADASQTGLDITGNLSTSFWVKIENAPSSGVSMSVFAKYVTGGNQRGYALSYNNSSGTYQFTVRTSTNGTASTFGTVNYTLTAGSWFHVANVYTAAAGTWQIYVNGVSAGTVTALGTSLFNNTAAFKIGYEADFDGAFDGLIDEFGIWSRAISAGEVAALYNAGTGLPYAAAASGPAKLKTRDTIAKASVKTIDGIAIASVKTADTIGS
jgi:hypothetical protein